MDGTDSDKGSARSLGIPRIGTFTLAIFRISVHCRGLVQRIVVSSNFLLSLLAYAPDVFKLTVYGSAELPLLFGTHYEYNANSTEFEWETSAGMQGKLR